MDDLTVDYNLVKLGAIDTAGELHLAAQRFTAVHDTGLEAARTDYLLLTYRPPDEPEDGARYEFQVDRAGRDVLRSVLKELDA